MNSYNGFSDEEIRTLVIAVKNGEVLSTSKSKVFEEFGKANSRAKGSVRNFYYSLLKSAETNAEIKEKYFNGCESLKARKIEGFNENDEKVLLKNVLSQKQKDNSIRQVILSLSKGDSKLSQRIQNKYRNLLKNNAPLVEKVREEIIAEKGSCFDPYKKERESIPISEFLVKKLSREIDDLYDRSSKSVREENSRLLEKIKLLEKENATLRSKVIS